VNLILLEPHELDPSGATTLDGPRAAHVLGVLRAGVGATVRVGMLDGALGSGVVTSVDPPRLSMRCRFDDGVPARPRVDLLLALPRPKVLRRLWAQLAALGVGHIILTNAARVERNYFDTHVLDPRVYRPLLIEGLQQARDTRLPEVSIHRQFRPLVEDDLSDTYAGDVCLVAHPGVPTSMASALAGCGARRVLLAIGPEGGWNAFELELLERHGFTTVGMGPRTLRVDTACIALLALAHDAIAHPADVLR
jgi:RsmE family RNA methyltransferase